MQAELEATTTTARGTAHHERAHVARHKSHVTRHTMQNMNADADAQRLKQRTAVSLSHLAQ